ncbi:2OG-Fe dioxygenase family protein [Kitasatospora sp. NPDC001175]|uniref:2OG-Fe dioxygenase family protein n=1 Tax=Kitasatospora sp. NPDC001175 TaxID=3157103 RepID=UPI003D0581EB
MITDVTAGHAQQIHQRGYTHGRLSAVLDPELLQGADWKQFADSWNNLRQDAYMADGGTYRRRRYSEFRYDTAADALTLLPHVPYRQSRDVNYLNGGIDRHFEAFESQVSASPVLRAIFQWCATVLLDPAGTAGTDVWKIQTFQNRILARSTEHGQPTPEGIHRDGVDYVLTLLIERNSIDGGLSRIYDAPTRECLDEVTLSEPGEFLYADDERMLHSVTPLTPAAKGVQGHRDVLIAMFSRTPKETR